MKAIFAVDQAGGMGIDGRMPWPKVPGDLAHFARLTTGGTVIMGRGTYESKDMPCPLPNRKNVVLSRSLERVKPGMTLCRAVDDLDALPSDSWVIGGAGVLHELWPRIDSAVVTVVKGTYAADTVFDMRLLTEQFQLMASDTHSAESFQIQHWIRT